MIGFKALLQTAVALDELLFLVLQSGLQGKVLLCQGSVVAQCPLLVLLDFLDLQNKK